jgi:ribosomal protein S18 acetylase RimI-like enzyme
MPAQQAVQSRYRVRAARPQDVGALANIHVTSWHYAYQGILAPHNLALTNFPRSLGRFRGYFWRGGQRHSLLHVAESDAGVVGYVNSGASNDRELGARGEVFELYLHPDAHGEGAGRKLLSAGLWALSGYRLVPAIVWVLADNHHARRFYEAMRGREVARGKVVVGDQLLDKVAYIWADYLPWPEWAI